MLEPVTQKATPLLNTKEHQSSIVACNNRSDLNFNATAMTTNDVTTTETKLSSLYATASVTAAAESAILNATANELNMMNNLDLMTDLETQNFNLTNLSNQNLNKFDDEEETYIIPNDIVEFNSMDDLVDFFNQEKSSNMLSNQNDYLHTHQNLLKINPNYQTLSTNTGASQQQMQKQPIAAGAGYDLAWFMNNSNKAFNEHSINSDDRYHANFPTENAKSNQNTSDLNK